MQCVFRARAISFPILDQDENVFRQFIYPANYMLHAGYKVGFFLVTLLLISGTKKTAAKTRNICLQIYQIKCPFKNLNFWILINVQVLAFTACQKSILTVRYGNPCPNDAASWDAAASRMNCGSIQQECSKALGLDPKIYLFQYHCLMNSWMNATVEVCALNRSILGKIDTIWF